jgi:hypothetical protein
MKSRLMPASTSGLEPQQWACQLSGSAAEDFPMWDEPYLETCCRSALHRLFLAGSTGRPPGMKDGPCLQRLVRMGLASSRPDGRFAITGAGLARHAEEIERSPPRPRSA